MILQASEVMVGVFVEEYEAEGRGVDVVEVVVEVRISVLCLPHTI